LSIFAQISNREKITSAGIDPSFICELRALRRGIDDSRNGKDGYPIVE
jgi:hypothetical protein